MKKAIIVLAALCLAGSAFAEKAANAPVAECFLLSSFGPSDDATSISVDIMRAQARGHRSMQGRVYSALEGLLRQGTISAETIAIQVNGSCDAALPIIRERLSVLALEQADTIGGRQLTEVNANWSEISALQFGRVNPSPVPAGR